MKLAYYPGCSLGSSAIEYGLSTKRTAEILGVELEEIKDWNCCGATSGHNTNKLLSLALPARNLAIAEKAGLDILAPCAACYNRFRNAEHAVREDAEVREKVEKIIDMEYKASNETLSVLDFLVDKIGTEKIEEKVVKPLKGMKAACYYGCLLVRPGKHTGFDDAEDPQSMDKIVKALGAQNIEWSHKTECCGAALATSRPDIGNTMIYKVLKNAQDNGADCIVTACPLCLMNLDMRQKAVEKEFKVKFNLPIYYVTELLAIACGDDYKTVGTQRHFVEAISYLENLSGEEETADNKLSKDISAIDKVENTEEEQEALKKKSEAFLKAMQKNPEKVATKLLDDEARIKVLAEIIATDEKKASKLAEFMASDNEKAKKSADAFVNAELKKRGKTQ